MTDPSNFKSLLFYFGLLSIKGVDMVGRPILHVPNLVVREQLFNFFDTRLHQAWHPLKLI